MAGKALSMAPRTQHSVHGRCHHLWVKNRRALGIQPSNTQVGDRVTVCLGSPAGNSRLRRASGKTLTARFFKTSLPVANILKTSFLITWPRDSLGNRDPDSSLSTQWASKCPEVTARSLPSMPSLPSPRTQVT